MGVGASSTIAGGGTKDYPLWISITEKRFSIGDHPPPSKSIKKNGATNNLGQRRRDTFCLGVESSPWGLGSSQVFCPPREENGFHQDEVGAQVRVVYLVGLKNSQIPTSCPPHTQLFLLRFHLCLPQMIVFPKKYIGLLIKLVLVQSVCASCASCASCAVFNEAHPVKSPCYTTSVCRWQKWAELWQQTDIKT